MFLPICIWGYKIFEPKKERTACALLCVCVPVEQQKGKQLTHFVAAVAASSFLYANCLPPTHGHPYIRTHYKGNTHVQANKLKAFNVFFIEGAAAILIPIANPLLSLFAFPYFVSFCALGKMSVLSPGFEEACILWIVNQMLYIERKQSGNFFRSD